MGPKVEPCGTPQVIVAVEEEKLPICERKSVY